MSELTTTPAWILTGQNGPSSLEFVGAFDLPRLGPNEVLVRVHAAALNYRELAIASGKFGLTLTPPITPSSDGAGEVLKVGSAVSAFKSGDKVVAHLTVHQGESEPASFADVAAGLGHGAHGTLRKYAVLHETSVVHMPKTLGYRGAATLTCSGLTAWNALFGPGLAAAKTGVRDVGKALEGKYVLVQGSGGVSVAALQFAVATGATVIATSSSDSKGARLSSLGAQHIVNYKTTPNWGEVAKSLTPNNRGFDIVVDVGGPSTVAQSLKAVNTDGLVALTGLLGASENVPSIMDALTHLCTTRGFLLGTREQFREMNALIDEKGIKPVVDDRVFAFAEVKEAYEYLEQQKHFSKVVIDVE
ncbi:hypothetical protein BDW74DRAFT_185813 [Aspergillus multicolor]|uniref:zinc-dependent alcohol dehydrogenase family protein n=1 Tax=Aspergillus multicolor TaxID=41759 RepID=UPI003CCCAF23